MLVSSSGRTRTYNQPVNSRPLCLLSYRGSFRYILYAIAAQLSNAFGQKQGKKSLLTPEHFVPIIVLIP